MKAVNLEKLSIFLSAYRIGLNSSIAYIHIIKWFQNVSFIIFIHTHIHTSEINKFNHDDYVSSCILILLWFCSIFNYAHFTCKFNLNWLSKIQKYHFKMPMFFKPKKPFLRFITTSSGLFACLNSHLFDVILDFS